MLSNTTVNSTLNNSSTVSETQARTQQVLAVLSYVMLFGLQFGISCAIDKEELLQTIRNHWLSVVLAFSGQLLLMPALSFGIAKILGLNDDHTIGILLIGCCPGGTMSNALVYFARADLPLSVSCTLITNVISIGTLPMLLYLWGQGFAQVSIPYGDVAGSMALVIVPTAMGIFLKQSSARYAAWGETFGSVLGAVMIISSIFAGIFGNLSTLQDSELLPATTWLACSLLPFGGGVIVFVTGLIVSLGSREAVSLLIEISQQNIPLATAIVNIAFANQALTASRFFQIQLFPVIYGLVATSEMVVVVLISRSFHAPLVEDEPSDKDMRQGPGGEGT